LLLCQHILVTNHVVLMFIKVSYRCWCIIICAVKAGIMVVVVAVASVVNCGHVLLIHSILVTYHCKFLVILIYCHLSS